VRALDSWSAHQSYSKTRLCCKHDVENNKRCGGNPKTMPSPRGPYQECPSMTSLLQCDYISHVPQASASISPPTAHFLPPPLSLSLSHTHSAFKCVDLQPSLSEGSFIDAVRVAVCSSEVKVNIPLHGLQVCNVMGFNVNLVSETSPDGRVSQVWGRDPTHGCRLMGRWGQSYQSLTSELLWQRWMKCCPT